MSDLLLKLSKFSVWYYHDIYDSVNSNLKKKYNLDNLTTKNINSAINNLIGLPNILIINERANHILSFL